MTIMSLKPVDCSSINPSPINVRRGEGVGTNDLDQRTRPPVEDTPRPNQYSIKEEWMRMKSVHTPVKDMNVVQHRQPNVPIGVSWETESGGMADTTSTARIHRGGDSFPRIPTTEATRKDMKKETCHLTQSSRKIIWMMVILGASRVAINFQTTLEHHVTL
jgi:hypothetical protein